MDITEKDLEDLIFDALSEDTDMLFNTGFVPVLIQSKHPNRVYWSRQVDLKQYGRADIIGYTRFQGNIHADVIELKNVPITCKDFEQLCRYMQATLEIIGNTFPKAQYPVVRGYLVGPSIDSGHYIDNFVYGISVYTFKYSLQGFSFEYHPGRWRRGSGDLKLSEISATSTVVHGCYTEIQNVFSNG